MRRPSQSFCAATVLLLLLCLQGCLELTGQRITIRHDQANDRLLLLIQHDGIHENDDHSPNGAEQIGEYLAEGDVMFLDWYLHIGRDDIRSDVEGGNLDPAARALGRAFLDDVRSYALGHYKDPEGRIGAAQLVVVEHVSGFVAKANAMYSEAIIASAESERTSGLRAETPRTFDKLLDAARRGHPWMSLSGHAVTLTFPVERTEWAAKKAEMLADWFSEWKKLLDRGTEDADEASPASLVQMLSSECVSFADTGETVSVTIGRSDRPATLRVVLRDQYNDDLESAVTEQVPQPLDDLIAARLLGVAGGELEPAQALAMSCFAPEDRVRAVLAWRSNPEFEEAATAWLDAFATDWNREYGALPAPAGGAADEEWHDWYLRVLSFPSQRKLIQAPATTK